MNWIEKMIAEQCPNGVKKVKLSQICVNQDKKRKPITSSKRVKGNTPYYGASGIVDYVEGYIFDGEYLLVSEDGANLIMRSTPIAFGITGKTWVNNHAHVLEFNHKCTQKLVEYYLNSIDLTPWIAGGAQPKLNQENLNKIEIPLPPLSVQKEIVRVLDKFSELIEKTDEEIALRQKQYEYYREKLYTPKENTKIVTISDLGAITRGKRFVRDDVKENGQPCIHYGDMYTYYGAKAYTTKTFLDRDFPKKMRYAKKGDIVIVGAGENDWDIGVGLAWFGDEPAAVHDACYILEHKENPMYISYFLRTGQYHQQLRKYVSDGKICSFSGTDLGKIKIPVPSLSRQQEIVETLDKFETLISKLKEERELRQKQYEYYREKLLTF